MRPQLLNTLVVLINYTKYVSNNALSVNEIKTLLMPTIATEKNLEFRCNKSRIFDLKRKISPIIH